MKMLTTVAVEIRVSVFFLGAHLKILGGELKILGRVGKYLVGN